MAEKKSIFNSSIVRKVWMSLTGLFLCSFLVVHLIGNTKLLGDEAHAREAFNAYAHFMTSFPLIKIISYLLYFSILFHAVWGIMLEVRNKAARPQNYAYNKPSANSGWASRNMGLLGTLLLVFIVSHMYQFWYVMHFGTIGTDASGNKDLYEVVTVFFRRPVLGWLGVAFYAFSMAAMGFHLWHGFQSAFQTLGVNHPRYTPIIRSVGSFFSIAVPALFALIPLIIALT